MLTDFLILLFFFLLLDSLKCREHDYSDRFSHFIFLNVSRNGTLGTDVIQMLEQRWTSILSQLQALHTELQELKISSDKLENGFQGPSDKNIEFVILSDPNHPPYSLVILLKLLKGRYKIEILSHVHSSVSLVPSELQSFLNGLLNSSSGSRCIKVTLIWKKVGKDPLLIQCPMTNGTIAGEVNISRYLNRLLEQRPNPVLVYESKGEFYAGQVDMWLDSIYKSVTHGSKDIHLDIMPSISAVLVKQDWLVHSVSIADICFWSSLKQNPCLVNFNSNVKKWFEKCQHIWFT